MAIKSVVPKYAKRELWAAIRRDMMRPVVFISLIATLSAVWWVSPLIYFFLWTYRAVPSGAIPLGTIIVLVLTAMAAGALMVSSVVRFSRVARPYGLAARGGDQEAKKKLAELRMSQPRPFQLFTCQICIVLAIAPLTSMILMAGDEGGQYVIRDHGRVHAGTRSEDVEQKLLSYRKRGIFRMMGD